MHYIQIQLAIDRDTLHSHILIDGQQTMKVILIYEYASPANEMV